jgi:CheY-like chemotaxis protein
MKKSVDGEDQPMNTVNTENRTASTIMIVDGDEDNRCLLKSILELKGFLVLQAADGQEAVELAIRKRPDLMLIELKLPILSGFTAIRRIRKYAELCQTPIIATSFNKPTSHRNLALAAGCAAHLEKPIEFDQLDMLLDRLLPGERVLLDSVLVH